MLERILPGGHIADGSVAIFAKRTGLHQFALRVHNVEGAAGKQLFRLVIQYLHIAYQNQRRFVWDFSCAVCCTVTPFGKAPGLIW